ncbi:MAG: ferritin [Candidatus Zixiibacteriota bacterium]
MIPEKIQKEFNNQINEEMFSAYLYLSMSAQFAEKSLDGFATWMAAQANEEMVHAMKFYNHIIERGGKVDLQAIDKPEGEWECPLCAFQAALKHEEHITARIDKLMDIAIKENDHASRTMLQWFVDEQVEEEASVGKIVDQLELIGDAKNGIFMMDKELSQRGQAE